MADEKFKGVAEDTKWSGKPILAFLIRAAILIVPIVASILFSIWLSRRLPPATTIWGLLGWWGAIIAASTIVLFSVDKLARRFLPLAALLSMTMVFPDKSPSRFKTALRSGSSVKHLKATLAEAEALGKDDDITHAAELVLQLTTALNTHDPRTRGHAERVRAYTDMLAEELGFSEMDRAKLRWASLLHDIGKLKVDTNILNKPTKLDDDEWLEIKKHPAYGKEICEPLWEWLGEWNGAILDHHERYDGNGYPNGKKAEEISMAGRVVCVADAYDVMTTVRSYKKPLPNAVAREELARHAGSQFDPHVVRAFLGLSMGRLRWVAGPLSWLGQLPFLNFAGAIQSVGTSVGVAGIAAVGAVGAISTGAVDIPGEDPLPLPEPPPVLAQFDTGKPVSVPVAANANATVAADDAFEIVGGEATDLAVLANDAVASGGVISIARVPDFGTVFINADGTVTYVPEEGFSGEDSFEYAIADDSGVSAPATVVLTVAAANVAPVAQDDAITTEEDTGVVIDVLVNDVDELDIEPGWIAIIADPINGTAVVDAETGTVAYEPSANFAGVDAFTYQLTDPEGLVGVAVVTITVAPINDPPVVRDASVSLAEDGSVTIDAVSLASDVDDGIDPAAVSIAVSPAFGSATVSPSGVITYSPIANANGVDGFAFSVCDLAGSCTTASAFVTVTPVNDPPVVPGPGPAALTEDETFTFDPLAGATDVDGDSLSLSGFDAVSVNGGSIAEGSLIYTPPLNFTGTDSFTYQVTDGTTTVSVTVVVDVTNVDHPPVQDGPVVASVIEDMASTFAPGDSFSDADLDPVGAVAVTVPASGTAVVNPDGTVTYTPNPDFFGSDSFDVTVSDGMFPITTSVTITVSNVNDDPVAVADTPSVPEDGSVTFGVLANDTDVDGDTLTLTGHDDAFILNGTLTPLGAGSFTYTPDPDFDGSEVFTYDIEDGNGGTSFGSVTIAVEPSPDAPVAEPDGTTVDEDSVTTITIDALANDWDPDTGDSVSFSSYDDSGVTEGTVTHLGDGVFQYGLPEDHHGTITWTYDIVDTTALVTTGTIEIVVNPIPDAPDAGDDGYLTGMDELLTVPSPGIIGNDVDHDEDPLTVNTAPVTPPTTGTLTLFADGGFTYDPDPGFTGSDTFEYEVLDGTGLSDVALVTVTVNSGVLGGFQYLGDTPDAYGGFMMVSVPPAAADPVPDVDGDGNPGFTVLEGDFDLDTAGPGEFVTWSITPTDALELDGPLSLDLWSTVAGFTIGEASHIGVGIYDCDALVPTSCTLLLEEDIHLGDWNGGVADWVNHQFNLGTLTHTVGVGRALVAKVIVKHGDLWIATTADYPSRFVYTAANLPPATVPDVYPGPSDPDYLEDDLSTITIDVAANDVDTDLDLSSLAIRTDLDPDPPHYGDPTPADLSLGTITAFPDGTVTYVLDPDMYGVDVFVYEICDTNAKCSTETVTVTILEVNDIPTFTPGADVTGIPESDGNQSVVAWATDIVLGPANEAHQKLKNLTNQPRFEVVVPDAAEASWFKDLPQIDKDGDLTFEFERFMHGTATVQVILRDDGGTANGGVDQTAPITFDITVDPVNDIPDWDKSADPDVDEDTGSHTFVAWADNIEAAKDAPAGPWDESTQTLTFSVDPQGPVDLDMFDPADLPSIDPATGDLTFTLKADAHGEANLTATLTDDASIDGTPQSFARDFKIKVDPIDDAPNAAPGTPSIDEDGGAQTITIGGIDAGGSGAWIETPTTIELVSATSGDLAVVSDATITYTSPNATAALTFTPVADRSGTVTISLTLRDWGANNLPGDADDVSQVITFPLAIEEVNDPPTVSDPSDVDAVVDSGPQSIAGFVSMTTAGTPDEDAAGQGVDSYLLSQTGTSNPALFSTAPAIDASGTLTFESAAGETGTATFDVQVKDDGGAPGDTSPAKSFTIAITNPIADIRMVGLAPASDADNPITALVNTTAAQTVYVHNDGPNTATGVSIVMPIDPALVTFDGPNSSPGCTFTAGPDIVECSVGDVASGADASAVIAVVPISTGSTSYVVTTATTAPDPDPFNNTALGFVEAIAPASTVVISEFTTDRGDDFVEIYNPTSGGIDISNWTLRVYPPDGSGAFVTVATVPNLTTLDPYTHYLFANAAAFANANSDTTFDVALYGGVEIATSGGAAVDGVGVEPRPGGDPATQGGAASREGTGVPPMNPGPLPQSLERLHGTAWDGSEHGSCVDTDDNAADFRHQSGGGVNPEGTSNGQEPCSIPSTVPPVTATGVVISEFRGDGPGGGNDEIIELFNASDTAVSLDGWTLDTYDAGWGVAFTFNALAVLQPYEHFLMATPNGTLSIAPIVPDAEYGGGAAVGLYGTATGRELKNGGGLRIVDGTATTIDLVGMDGSPAEGTPLPKFDGRGTHTYERILGGSSGSCVDTGNNIDDFRYRLIQGPQGLGVVTPCL